MIEYEDNSINREIRKNGYYSIGNKVYKRGTVSAYSSATCILSEIP